MINSARALGTGRRLTQPSTPRTSGLVECFNGRIANVLKTRRFSSGQDLDKTLMRYVARYNHQLPQAALNSKTPIQAVRDWYACRLDLLHKRPCDGS